MAIQPSSPLKCVPRIVAAGRGKSVALAPISKKIIELTEKLQPTILYLGTATYDREGPFLAQTKGLRKAGCNIIKLNLCDDATNDDDESSVVYGASQDEIIKAFDEADALLASGGNTMHALKRWRECGVDDMIREAAFRDDDPLVLCGGSAGAVCWFAHGHSDSMDPMNVPNPDPNMTEEEKMDWDYIRVPGMNIIPALCVPHHDVTPSNGKPRSSDSNTMVLKNPQEPGIGIDEKAALVVVGDQVSVVSADGVSKCYAKVCQIEGQEKKLDERPIEESHGELNISDLLVS